MSELDKILTDYERECNGTFDSVVLQKFINKNPDHAEALRCYSIAQIIFIPETQEEREQDDP